MSSPILEADYSHFPQPPEDIQARILGDSTALQIGHVAMENMLAGTNSETKAIALLLAPEDETALPLVAERFRQLSDPKIRSPRLSVFRDVYRKYTPLGLIHYDPKEDTVKRNPDQEVAFAFTNHLLGIGLDTCISLADLVGLHHGEFSWDGFTNVNHLTRLAMVMRIGQSGKTGVTTQEVIDSIDPYTTHVGRVLSISDGLIANRHAYTKKESRGHRRHFPADSLTTAYESLVNLVETLAEDPEALVYQAETINDKVLKPGIMSYLYRRGYIRSGRSFADQRQPLHDVIANYIDLCPEGVDIHKLYDLFGEGYKDTKTFGSAVSWMSHNLPNASFYFHGHSTQGRWLPKNPNSNRKNSSDI